MKNTVLVIPIIALIIFVSGCTTSPQPGPDSPDLFSMLSKGDSKAYTAEFEFLQNNELVEMAGFIRYSDGKGKTRFDTVSADDQVRIYILPESGYVCNYNNNWTCEEAVVSVSKTYMPEQQLTELKEASDYLNINSTGTRTIAGVNTFCFMIQTPGTDFYQSSIEACINGDGVLLSQKIIVISADQEFSTELRAVSYTPGVSEVDFELPAEALNQSIQT